jgi:hypothetical protein
MAKFVKGDVVVVPFPFTDLKEDLCPEICSPEELLEAKI